MTSLLSKQISSIVDVYMNHVLEEIAHTYGLNELELKMKWGSTRAQASVASISPCVAAVPSSIMPDTSECGGGGECCAPEPLTKPKKSPVTKSRKKKQKEEVIETEEYEYDGVKYLVDNQNNVYTYNIEEPALVGEKLVDGTVKLFV
jgi:hypothetical protein